MEAVYAGVDVSKQWLDVGLWPGSESLRLSNDASGVAELVERLRALSPVRVVLARRREAGEVPAACGEAAVADGRRGNPRQVREFARSLGTHRPARRGVRASSHSPSHTNGRLQAPMRLADEAEAELKALVVRRRQLIGMLVAETNRRERAPKVVRKSIVQTIKGLKRAVAEVVQLKQVLAGSPTQQTSRPARCGAEPP